MMTLYKNDIGAEILLETDFVDLSTASSIKINVMKPSGTEVEWIALQYDDTTQIIYTTVSGDLDEVGTYVLQPSIIRLGVTYLRDAVETEVYDEYSVVVSISQLIRQFALRYRTISVQTFVEHNSDPEDGTDCEILFDEFQMFYDSANDELDNILDARSITLTDNQRYVALCHLIADYYEMGNPDWSFRSQSMGSGVSFSRGEDTGARLALNKMLDIIQAAAKATRKPTVSMGSDDIKEHKDSTNYPRRFKKTAIPAWNFNKDKFDESEVYDDGYSDDRTY